MAESHKVCPVCGKLKITLDRWDDKGAFDWLICGDADDHVEALVAERQAHAETRRKRDEALRLHHLAMSTRIETKTGVLAEVIAERDAEKARADALLSMQLAERKDMQEQINSLAAQLAEARQIIDDIDDHAKAAPTAREPWADLHQIEVIAEEFMRRTESPLTLLYEKALAFAKAKMAEEDEPSPAEAESREVDAMVALDDFRAALDVVKR